MALPAPGGDGYPPYYPSGGPYYPAKRRTAETIADDNADYSRQKRPKYTEPAWFAASVAYKTAESRHETPLGHPSLHHPHPHHPHQRYPSPRPYISSPEPVTNAPAAPTPPTGAPEMERTASGHSIRPDPTERWASTELLEDDEAAQRVRDHLATFRRRNPDSKHERILRSIINPRPRPRRPHQHHNHRRSHSIPKADHPDQDEYPIDNEALESIFSAANEIFFNGRLSQRVSWDWSHASSTRYDSRVIGTTALRRAAAHTRGFETLIVLSSTILRDPSYSRRLLISTFLHELIHCYLFICCGFRARWCGGHTKGFREIAEVIDDWVGESSVLFLKSVEADLELFRVGGDGEHLAEEERGRMGVEGARSPQERGNGADGKASFHPCSGMGPDQEEYSTAPAMGHDAASQGYFTTHGMAYFSAGGGHTRGASTSSQDTAYFSRGASPISRHVTRPGTRPGTPAQNGVKGGYFGRGTPSPRPSTPNRDLGYQHYYQLDRPASSNSMSSTGGSNNALWRHRRAPAPARPLYVYTGEEASPSYVYTYPTDPRP
ncbi:uncharacterized protein C8A04DRAFT_24408 [Dichotomopilus funicola]|uniref:SprT-like domain-containing protein n=1 Tax=Dichotomopilus funicola TaxID=1934379 RepID=A0AAN6VAQ5_9PEZI|nr:hypothetical protein C8A04DRAFT_24408 [Dichotomopilus funicola]